MNPSDGVFNSPADLYSAREAALLNMMRSFHARSPELSLQAGYVILSGIIKWQPHNEHLAAAIVALKKLRLRDWRPQKLQLLLDQARSRSKAADVGLPAVADERKPVESTVSKRVFVVHGHDELDRRRLTELLEKDLGLETVVVQEEENDTFETIFLKIERLAESCDTAIILVTPDDETTDGMRPRQNVVLELGYFLGLWKHHMPRRIIVLKKGDLQLLSDVAGVVYLGYTQDPKECFRDLQRQLKAWGLPIE